MKNHPKDLEGPENQDNPRNKRKFKSKPKKGIASNFAQELEQETKKWYQEVRYPNREFPDYLLIIVDL